MKTVFTVGTNGFKNAPSKYAIEVRQAEDKKGRFTVIYGLQVKKELGYAAACLELGSCILHMQACDGIVNNDGEY